jgi:hypothetical protein
MRGGGMLLGFGKNFDCKIAIGNQPRRPASGGTIVRGWAMWSSL